MPFDATPTQHPCAAEIATIDRMTERLVTDGWCQGQLVNGTRRCFIGALHDAGCPPTSARYIRIALAAKLAVGEPVHDWQDRPGRTLNDVLDLLSYLRRQFEMSP
jgi:hypothetical protein